MSTLVEDTRILYGLNIEVERVESTYSPVDGFQATLAIDLRTLDDPDRKPVLIAVQITPEEMRGLDADGIAEAVDAKCATVADRYVRSVLAGDIAPGTPLPLLRSQPRHPHGDRARALAGLLYAPEAKRAELAALHGPRWAEVMIESELRALFSEGAKVGYNAKVTETREATAIGEWFVNELQPRIFDGPRPFTKFEGDEMFNLKPRTEDDD